MRLERILDEHLPEGQSIDILSVDAEAHDLEVLQSNNWEKYRPEVVVVEARISAVEQFADSPITRFLAEVGYEARAWLPPSAMFVRQAEKADGRKPTE